MRPAIDPVLSAHGKVATRAQLLTVATPAQLDDEIRRARLARVFRRTYSRPWDAELPDVRERVALASVQAPARLSGLTALRRWRSTDPTGRIDVAVPPARFLRSQPGVRVRRVVERNCSG